MKLLKAFKVISSIPRDVQEGIAYETQYKEHPKEVLNIVQNHLDDDPDYYKHLNFSQDWDRRNRTEAID